MGIWLELYWQNNKNKGGRNESRKIEQRDYENNSNEEFGNKMEVSEHLKEINDAEQIKIENNSNEPVNANHILSKRVYGKWIVKLCRLNTNMNLFG